MKLSEGEIKYCINLFRRAVEMALHKGEFANDCVFKSFPKGSCGDTCLLLSKYLLDRSRNTNIICLWNIK